MKLRRASMLAFLAMGALVLSATPVLAQGSESIGSGDNTMVIVGAITAGVALFLLVFILLSSDSRVEKGLTGRLGSYVDVDQERTGLSRIPLIRRFISRAESVAEERGLLVNIERALEQANLPVRPGEAIAGAIAGAILFTLAVGVYARSIIWAIIAGVIALLAVAATIQTLANRERTRFEGQLPDTLNLISTSLRAGYSLLQAVEAVASEAPQPTGREFRRAITETRLGRPPTEALKDISDRMGSTDFEWAVLAIGIQREVGGNLAEVLQTAAETMMHRNRLRREMKALTAEGRISALVLGGLPFGLFAFLFTTNRDYVQPLLDSFGGIVTIIGALGLLLLGIFWLTRIVKVEI